MAYGWPHARSVCELTLRRGAPDIPATRMTEEGRPPLLAVGGALHRVSELYLLTGERATLNYSSYARALLQLAAQQSRGS